jgi:hypothetical protein
MKRLGRDAAELTALADHVTAHGLVLEMLAGPLAGIYDPSGPGRMLFAFFGHGRTRDHPRSDPGGPGHSRPRRQTRRPAEPTTVTEVGTTFMLHP